MGSRFDEVEIVHIDDLLPRVAAPGETSSGATAPTVEPPRVGPPLAARWRRATAFLIDLSLFVAAGLALMPLLPKRGDILSLVETEFLSLFAFVGFLLLVSFYYFFGAWLIWGRTIGGAICDVRVVSSSGAPLDAVSVSKRWIVTLASVLTGFIGFLPALLPARRSMADRISGTDCIAG